MNRLRLSKRLVICCVIIGACLFSARSYAGAWPVRKGKFILSPSVNYFFANKLWDSNGKLQSYNNNGRFTSLGFYLYGEYGLFRRLTLVASVPYVRNNYTQSDYANSANGLTDAEIGGRYYLANINYKSYFAVQGTVVAPLYHNTATNSLGYEKLGGDIKLVGSVSGSLGSKNVYFNVEGGVRRYFSDTGPFQYRYSTAFGFSLTKHHNFSLSASGLVSNSINKSFSPNLLVNKNFSYMQGAFTYIYTINQAVSFSAGVNKFLTGVNTGAGTSLSFATVLKF